MNCEVRARVGERHSERFEVDQGVRQGCTLSPWLFNVFLDTIAKETREGFTGVRLGDEIVVLLLLMTCVLDGTCTMWSHSCSLHDTVEMMVMVLVTAHNVAIASLFMIAKCAVRDSPTMFCTSMAYIGTTDHYNY